MLNLAITIHEYEHEIRRIDLGINKIYESKNKVKFRIRYDMLYLDARRRASNPRGAFQGILPQVFFPGQCIKKLAVKVIMFRRKSAQDAGFF